MCKLCCRSSLCSSSWRCSSRWTSTAWGGRGSPTFPGLWGRVMASRATTCQAKVHGHTTKHLRLPSPWGPPSIPGRFVGWGFSLHRAERGVEAGAEQGPGQWGRGSLCTLSLSWASTAPRREQPLALGLSLAHDLGKALPSLGLSFSVDEQFNTVMSKGCSVTQDGPMCSLFLHVPTQPHFAHTDFLSRRNPSLSLACLAPLRLRSLSGECCG